MGRPWEKRCFSQNRIRKETHEKKGRQRRLQDPPARRARPCSQRQPRSTADRRAAAAQWRSPPAGVDDLHRKADRSWPNRPRGGCRSADLSERTRRRPARARRAVARRGDQDRRSLGAQFCPGQRCGHRREKAGNIEKNREEEMGRRRRIPGRVETHRVRRESAEPESVHKSTSASPGPYTNRRGRLDAAPYITGVSTRWKQNRHHKI